MVDPKNLNIELFCEITDIFEICFAVSVQNHEAMVEFIL